MEYRTRWDVGEREEAGEIGRREGVYAPCSCCVSVVFRLGIPLARSGRLFLVSNDLLAVPGCCALHKNDVVIVAHMCDY